MTGRSNNCQLSIEGSTPRLFFADDFYWVARSAYPVLVLSVLFFVSGCGYFDHTKKYPCAANFDDCTLDVKSQICLNNYQTEPGCFQFCLDNPTICPIGDAANGVGIGDSATSTTEAGGDDTQGGGSGNNVASGGSGGNGASAGTGGNSGVTGGAGGTDTDSGGSGEEPETRCDDIRNPCDDGRVCDPDSGTCEEVCLSDGKGCEQVEGKPICDTRDNNRQCVGCLKNDHCKTERKTYCNTNSSDKSDYECVECLDDEHCPGACDPVRHECVLCRKEGRTPVGCIDTPATPVCKVADTSDKNQCVQCAANSDCSDKTPICDTDNNTCRSCQRHEECDDGNGVCNWATGACLNNTEVIHVAKCNGTGRGEKNNPYCNLQTAVNNRASSTKPILAAAGTYGPISLSENNKKVWIVGKSGAKISNPDTIAVNLSGMAQLTLEGFEITSTSTSGVGVYCSGTPSAYPTVTLDRNKITNNAGGGVYLNACGFTLTNNVIAKNGGTSSYYGGVRIIAPVSTKVFLNNTVVGNLTSSEPSGVRCDDAAELRNSIIYKNTGTVGQLSDNCTVNYSLVSDNSGTTGIENIRDKNPSFVDEAGLDYRLNTTSPCVNAADPNPNSHPRNDLNGEKRPKPANGRADIGAYEAG